MHVPKPVIIVVAILLLLWAGLFWSGSAFLVWGTGPDKDRAVGMLKCTYFSGGGLVKREFLYSKQGFLGRDTCPRSIDLDQGLRGHNE